MEHNELKKCPFCGNKANNFLSYDFIKKQSRYIVCCSKCNATMNYRNKKSAITAWNRRANDGT
jgi:Lar family restriction alleviation protein